jgi:hypothetical protein
MRNFKACAAAAALLAALTTALPANSTAAAEEGGGAAPLEPLSFLAGHCWKGVFPGTRITDEHCFSWVYGGKFLRDRHVVRSDPNAQEKGGETIYLWNSKTRAIEYLYIESDGGYLRGSVSSDGATLNFPESQYTEDGQEQGVRSRWQRAGDDAYDVVTEFRKGADWSPGFRLHMERVKTGQ